MSLTPAFLAFQKKRPEYLESGAKSIIQNQIDLIEGEGNNAGNDFQPEQVTTFVPSSHSPSLNKITKFKPSLISRPSFSAKDLNRDFSDPAFPNPNYSAEAKKPTKRRGRVRNFLTLYLAFTSKTSWKQQNHPPQITPPQDLEKIMGSQIKKNRSSV